MNGDMTTEVSVPERSLPALARQNPQALAMRLSDMKENRRLTQQFFKEVMEDGVDFGTIPGTDKPTLYKPGAEGLCELYGYAPTYNTSETSDMATGFLRVVVTCTLVQRGTGEVVAQGLGECNTREARYFYRWMSESQLRKIPDLYNIRDSFKKEERAGKDKKTGREWKAIYYRTENDDLFTLWNTVLKMAKKRAHVDATLSATRSSGLFSQGAAALEDWIEADYEDVTDRVATPVPETPPAAPTEPTLLPARLTMDEMNEVAARLDAIKTLQGAGVFKEAIAMLQAAVPYATSPSGKGITPSEVLQADFLGVQSILREIEARASVEPQPSLPV